VGYEGDIITGEVFQKQNNRKFIPILKKGNWKESSPTFIMGKYYVDLRNITDFESNYNDLITTILNRREVAPPIGQYQQSKSTMQVFKEDEHSIMPEIKIKGILVDEIGKPLNDGTQGSSLYRIPFELNMRPDNLWAELFRYTWDLPPQCTTGHRPGIGFVSGNKIILEKTKIEEVKEIHKNTLKLVVETVNKQYTEIKLKEKIKKEKEEQERIRQHQKIMNIANDIKF
ncbi:MAG TPA: hypothetical protein PKY56_12465, partial [Candidatus Kapabacteria bacterium]|nr:hypothetical protein [Candidatus Kapabacteria bacterium]